MADDSPRRRGRAVTPGTAVARATDPRQAAGAAGIDGTLLPDRHPTPDFFLCDILDALPKDDLASMEHPIFSLATRPDRRILRYEHNGAGIEIVPSVKGLATLFDKDILIYCISQLMAAVNAGRPVARTLQLTAHDLMVATNRETSGDGYKRLREGFERLAGTRITTNITTGMVEATTGFGLIESWQILRHARGGRMISVSVTLSEWLFRAVMSKSVLTLSREYFRLRKPLERRVYELARKHCGRQPDWRISMATLAKKSGSASPVRVFRKMMRDMIAADPLPDYSLSEEPGDMLCVRRREAVVDDLGMVAASGFGAGGYARGPVISERARDRVRALVPGADVHALEAEWRGMWERSGRAALKSPDAAFAGWARKRAGL